MIDPLDLEAQRRSREGNAEQDKLEALTQSEDLKWLMADKRGRRFMWRLLERTGIYRSSFTGNSETFFREGERNVGLAVMADLMDFCPERYAQMIKEQKQ